MATKALGTSYSVRITAAQHRVLTEVADALGASVNGLVQKAVSNWINDEAPVWMEAADTVRGKIARKKKVVTA